MIIKITKLWDSTRARFKSLGEKIRLKGIELLGGYTFPPVAPEIKSESITTVPVTASIMVDKYRYDRDLGYRLAISHRLAGDLGLQIFANDAMSPETVVELNDNEYIVKVSAKLVKEEQ